MNYELGSRGQEDLPSLHGRGEGRVLGISYDQLSAEVRHYADNLKAQIWAVFARYGVGRPPHPNPLPQGERESSTISPPLTGGDQGEGVEVEPRFEGQRGSTSIIDDLKAKNPSLQDLEHLSDLLEQLDHIRKTGEPMERTKRELSYLVLEFSYNETEAKRLGLKKVEVNGYPEADHLIQQVIDGSINIETEEGQDKFIKAWSATCPDLPPPCAPDLNNFWYLSQLKNKRIISNLDGDPKPITPNFTADEILLIDSWKETDWNSPDAKTKLTSPLLLELLGKESVVNIQRQDLDAALWQGDPALHLPTQKHQAILEKLNLSSDDFELRPIRQDEYVRLVRTKGWGAHNLWTNFDHYSLGDDGDRYGLGGGDRMDGGPSGVSSGWRDDADGVMAVRLVLARKAE